MEFCGRRRSFFFENEGKKEKSGICGFSVLRSTA